MSSGTPSDEIAVAGIHVQQARDVTLRAGGDIVAGDKTTIHNYYGPKPQDITKAPYKFLSYYDIGDRDIFFGRDAVIEELAGEIPRHKVLIINGQSGSGKTSLLNAGLIPRLAENGYLYVYFRDYSNPLEQLREYFRNHPDFALPGADQLSLLQILRAIRSQQESPVVVIFDQFERFLINVAAEPRREFLQQLRECLESDLPAHELNLVISLRDDFYGKLLLEAEAIIPTFGTDSHHHNLRTLNRDEARQAIIQPLKNIPNIGFDGKFVDDVLLPHLMGQATGEAKIEPPHLQIVCNQLYEAARDRNRQQLEDGEPVRIGFDLYHALGETEGMLRDYLDDVVRRITNGDPQQIAIVRSTLKLMIETVGTRKFESVDDVSTNLPDVPRAEAARIIEKLQEFRVLEAKQSGNETEYSLSHEFMVAKVQSWYDERELQRKKAKDTLDSGLVRWASTQALLDDVEIEAIQQWLPDASNHDDVRDLLAQSTKRQARLKWQRRTVYAAVTFAALLMPIAVIGWFKSASNAEQLRIEKSSFRQFAATGELTKGLELCESGRLIDGLLWLARSLQTAPDDAGDLQTTIRQNIAAWKAPINQLVSWQRYEKVLSISTNGQKVATLSTQGDVQFWDTCTGALLGQLEPRPGIVRALAFGCDEKVVTASEDGTIQLWNVNNGKPVGIPIPDAGKIAPNGLALSWDGKQLLTASENSEFRVWNLESREIVRAFRPDGLAGYCVAISPDGEKIATSGLDCGFVLDSEGNTIGRIFLEGGWNTIQTVAFSSDGERLLAGNGIDAQIVFVNQMDSSDPNLKRLKPSGILFPNGGKLVAFHEGEKSGSEGGDEIVTSNGNDIEMWRLSESLESRDSPPTEMLTSQPRLPFRGDEIGAIVGGSDGRLIVIASGERNSSLRFWNLESQVPLKETISHNQEQYGVLFRSTANDVVTVGAINKDGNTSDGRIHVWKRPDASAAIEPLEPIRYQIEAAAFSPDGRYVAVAIRNDTIWRSEVTPLNEGRTVRVWDLQSGTVFGRSVQHNGRVFGLALGSEGRRVVTSSKREVQMWDIETGQPIGRSLQHREDIFALALATDGRQIVTCGAGNTADIWQVPTAVEGSPEQVRLWVERITRSELDHNDSVRSLGFDSWKQRRER